MDGSRLALSSQLLAGLLHPEMQQPRQRVYYIHYFIRNSGWPAGFHSGPVGQWLVYHGTYGPCTRLTRNGGGCAYWQRMHQKFLSEVPLSKGIRATSGTHFKTKLASSETNKNMFHWPKIWQSYISRLVLTKTFFVSACEGGEGLKQGASGLPCDRIFYRKEYETRIAMNTN